MTRWIMNIWVEKNRNVVASTKNHTILTSHHPTQNRRIVITVAVM